MHHLRTRGNLKEAATGLGERYKVGTAFKCTKGMQRKGAPAQGRQNQNLSFPLPALPSLPSRNNKHANVSNLLCVRLKKPEKEEE